MSDQITKDLGGITAYAAAVAAGYTGTKSQFETLMASYATVAQNAAASASAAADSEENAEAWADGERGGTPVSSGDETYHNNAKYYAEQAEDFADSIDPDKIESHIDAAYIKETASGSIATFSDGAPAPVRNLIAEIVPVQSGSGDPSPDNVRAISGWTEANISVTGVNVWDEEWENKRGWSTGEMTNDADNIASKNYIPVVPNTEYYFKAPSGVGVYLYGYDSNKNYLGLLTLTNSKFDSLNAHYMKFATRTSNYGTYNNDISINYPSTDTSYHAYNGETHTISFASAGTVYGGRLDVTSGVLTVDRTITDLGDLGWSYNGKVGGVSRFSAGIPGMLATTSGFTAKLACSSYLVNGSPVTGSGVDKTVCRYGADIYINDDSYSGASAFTTAVTGAKLVYPLATPQTYQLTPTEVKTLLKNNNIWADTGDVTVEYVADTKTFIEELINA